MNDITFNKQMGGLGRVPEGKDHYAGLVFFTNAKPNGFGVENVKEIVSLDAAELLGITADNSDKLIQVMHYHLKRFFAVYNFMGVKSKLWLMAAPKADETKFETLPELINEADGEIRNIGVFNTTTLNNTLVNALNAKVMEFEAKHAPFSALLAADISALADLTTAIDLRKNCTAPKVSVTIGQDGKGEGAALFADYGKSVTDLGSALAWASIKQVHECIGWVEKFNAAFDGEFDIPALANGKLIKEVDSYLDGLNSKGYIFMRKVIGVAGSYFNDSHACTTITSDYAYLENNQTIDKATRLVYMGLIPKLNSPIQIDATTGKIDRVTISVLEGEAERYLSQMLIDGEVSGYKVSIDPDQDILTTSQLVVDVQLVINGVARQIKVNIGFTKKLE